ncbi:hypothetical protein PAPYR_3883 [Paratrimastix pyriformis]|uniref:GMP phosphodiesterase delta subunit domain-containing protein n=1 Tax=Paratrimastix pyriformis TaxID=342808 RepID=A0ABQ8UPE2_9EUKA|nr:hypothetical protein PAPYR_3883 [Paratrimastix pyriformis]|eukprot:GAFH01003444.1.p1 GENE.GAFH01003444.1~~GAFH01003444.1.p1  ORF type:complete len:212 (+),score=7.84 GAFH01003444.1:31-666(+)
MSSKPTAAKPAVAAASASARASSTASAHPVAGARPSPTPENVLRLPGYTSDYLCPIEANTVGLNFLHFKIRDMDTKRVYFEVAQDPKIAQVGIARCDPTGRLIQYTFPREFLHSKNIGTALKFSVGPQPLENFRMIERHYFRNQLIRSYDFTFGFVIPSSTNSWEVIYDVPPLPADLVQQMVAHPHETRSDSFYFVGDTLVMHCKATYAYQ